MTKHVLVPVANGTCGCELVCVSECLIRAGAHVVTASIDGNRFKVCKMKWNKQFQADINFKEAVGKDWDLIVLPGGINGSLTMRDCEELKTMLLRQKATPNKFYAAGGESPAIVLASVEGLIRPGATCLPKKKYRDMIPDATDDDIVIQHGGLVTSQGVGCALAFGIVLVELLYGKPVADEVARRMMVDRTGQMGYRYVPSETAGPVFRAPAFQVIQQDDADGGGLCAEEEQYLIEKRRKRNEVEEPKPKRQKLEAGCNVLETWKVE